MAIITKPSTIDKDSPATITLNKSQLALVSSVAGDSYFSDQSNWKNVIIYYKSNVGNQKEILNFDATQSSPTTSFLVSDKARDTFEVQKIIIKDFDGGSFSVSRSELTVAEFDITFSSGPQVGTLLTYESLSGFSANPAGTQVTTTLPVGQARAVDTNSLGQVVSGVATYDITFELDQFDFDSYVNGEIKVGWNMLSNNFQSWTGTYVSILSSEMRVFSYAALLNSKPSLGVPSNFAGVKKIRMVQEGNNQLKIYVDDVLEFTETITQSFDDIFPYVESFRQVRLAQSYKP